ncbi:LPA1 [Scenedesmus sp. PABB004]|nr:LPA1 [Scenedesmus sp. PABB004]
MTPQEELRKREGDRVQLRSEAEAPWRALRLVFYGFSVASAGVASLISVPQLIGATAGVPGALAVESVIQNIGINLGAVTVFGLLFRQDWLAREKQLDRLRREDALAGLPIALGNGKRLRLGALQGSSRVVVVAGTPQQVADALAAAEPHREALQRRGVFVVPLPVFGDQAGAPPLSPPGPDELRWRAAALQPDAWRGWFAEQLEGKAATPDRGLFVGLRLDGRVRSSGMGPPPWARYAVELAPLEGEDKWTGFFDGFDGKV